MAKADNGSTGVGVLDRVMAILDAVEAAPRSATDLARDLELSVPTAHRLVSAMLKHGLLQRDLEGRVSVGPRFASSALTLAAAPVLEGLQAQTGETAQLWVLRGTDRLCVASVESAEELRAAVPVGTVLPLTAQGSAAKALAAATGEHQEQALSSRSSPDASSSPSPASPSSAHARTAEDGDAGDGTAESGVPARIPSKESR